MVTNPLRKLELFNKKLFLKNKINKPSQLTITITADSHSNSNIIYQFYYFEQTFDYSIVDIGHSLIENKLPDYTHKYNPVVYGSDNRFINLEIPYKYNVLIYDPDQNTAYNSTLTAISDCTGGTLYFSFINITGNNPTADIKITSFI